MFDRLCHFAGAEGVGYIDHEAVDGRAGTSEALRCLQRNEAEARLFGIRIDAGDREFCGQRVLAFPLIDGGFPGGVALSRPFFIAQSRWIRR